MYSISDNKKVTSEKALKRLYELSLKTIGVIPQLDKPNEEQEQWLKEKRFHK